MLEWKITLPRKISSIYDLQYPSPGYVRVENNPAS